MDRVQEDENAGDMREGRSIRCSGNEKPTAGKGGTGRAQGHRKCKITHRRTDRELSQMPNAGFGFFYSTTMRSTRAARMPSTPENPNVQTAMSLGHDICTGSKTKTKQKDLIKKKNLT